MFRCPLCTIYVFDSIKTKYLKYYHELMSNIHIEYLLFVETFILFYKIFIKIAQVFLIMSTQLTQWNVLLNHMVILVCVVCMLDFIRPCSTELQHTCFDSASTNHSSSEPMLIPLCWWQLFCLGTFPSPQSSEDNWAGALTKKSNNERKSGTPWGTSIVQTVL